MKREVVRMLQAETSKHREGNGATSTAVLLPTSVNSVLIDYYLWNYAKSNSSSMAHLPIHRTLTIFY